MLPINEKRVDAINVAEKQIESEKQNIDYDTRELTIEELVQRYDHARIYLPKYKKEFLWDEYQQSRLIESVILGLPIPPLFIANTGHILFNQEMVDGAQRIKTLAAFLANKLCLKGLTILEKLNGFSFEDLSAFRQRKFKNTPMRIIVLSDTFDKVKNDIFDRLNPYRVEPIKQTPNLFQKQDRLQESELTLIGSLPDTHEGHTQPGLFSCK